MEEDENKAGKEQMLNLKERTMLGKGSAYFYLGVRCKIMMLNQIKNTEYSSKQRSISSQSLLAPSTFFKYLKYN